MKTREGMMRLLWGAVLVLVALGVGCSGGQDVGDEEADRLRAREACLLGAQNNSSLGVEISNRFETALGVKRNKAILEDLLVFQTRFEDLRREVDLVAAYQCDDPLSEEIEHEQHVWRRACLNKSPEVMRTLRDVLKRQVDLDLDTLVWALESNLLGLEHALTCDAEDAELAAREPIALTVHLICEKRKNSGAFTVLPACSEEELVEGDRVRFGFSVDKDAYLYVLNYNTKGQFQMLFPDKGVDNVVNAGDAIFLPGYNEAFTLDSIANVIERMQIVASTERIDALEEIRGLDVPVGRQGRMPTVINVLRGDLEVASQRWLFQKGESVQLKLGSQTFETIPMTASSPGMAVVEFPIRHGDPPKVAKVQPKVEPKVQPKVEPKVEPKVQPKVGGDAPKTSAYEKAILKQKPWAYWRMESTSGKTGLRDMSGGLDLKFSGGRSLRPTAIKGDPGKSLRFDEGAFAYADDVRFPRKSISVEFWVKAERNEDYEETPFSYATEDEDNEFLIHNLNDVRLYVGGDQIKTEKRIANGRWRHVVVTWKSSTGRLRLYVDGERIWSGTANKGKSLERGGTLILGQEQDCLKGCFKDTQGLFGDIDEVAVYDKVLSSDVIARHYRMRK